MAKSVNVLFVTGEAAPFVKTGGLADVSGSLPKALTEFGINVCVMLPKYAAIDSKYKLNMRHLCDFNVTLGWRNQYCGIDELVLDGIRYFFIDNEYYFGGSYIYSKNAIEECERFCFFDKAVLEFLRHTDFRPNIIHGNDWQTGMIFTLLSTQYRREPLYKTIASLFTIHNMHYQGVFSWEQTRDLLSLDEWLYTPECLEFYGGVSFIKGGMIFSDMVNTVSPSYADEVKQPFYGEKLDGLTRRIADKFTGIQNGIDNARYNPQTDDCLNAHYSSSDISGKEHCKAAVQEELWLDKRADVPLIIMISRLVDHKGIDLVECVIEDILRMDVQFAVLGCGDVRYEKLFKDIACRYGGKASVKSDKDDNLARRMYAGSDIFLMPSLFEPCGISQMLAMRYGSIPVVRETGGLRDSIEPYNMYTDTGNGFSFTNYNAHELLFTVERAVDCFYNKKNVWAGLVKRAMETDFGWESSAHEYAELYRRITTD